MSTVGEKLHKWCIQELNLVSEGGLTRVPDSENVCCLAKGKNKKIWTYVINHVRSKSAVAKVKRTLHLKQILKENEDNILSFDDGSSDVNKMQMCVAKAIEKRMFLKRSLSTIEERILNIEQNIGKTNTDILEIKQRTAFLELLNQLYNEKNVSLKALYNKIVSCLEGLRAYQSASKFSSQEDMLYDLYGCKPAYCGTSSKIGELINTISSLITTKFNPNGENYGILIENFQNNNYELKMRGVLLDNLATRLQELCVIDMQDFIPTSLQSVSMKDFFKHQEHEAKQLLTQMKYDNVCHSLNVIKNKRKMCELLDVKEKMFKDKVKDLKDELGDIDFETKCALFKILAENAALVLCNNYLEKQLKIASSETEKLKQLCGEKYVEHDSIAQKFYMDANLTFYLLYTAMDVFSKVIDDLNNLQSFTQNELLESRPLSLKGVNDMKSLLISDRKVMWKYCEETNLIQSLFLKPYAISYPLLSDVRKYLIILPFQNIGTLFENWTCFKRKLQSEAVAHAQAYVINDKVSVLEMYTKFMNMLEKMKYSIEKGMQFTGDGKVCCSKTKSLIQEWWEQNAQFIPDIEHKEKTLKMWIDILSILSDFEPLSCTS